MANKKMHPCKTCNEEIARSAKTCPKCGAKNKKGKGWWWRIPMFLIGLVFLISLLENEFGSLQELPTCEQTHDVKRVFADGPLAKISNLKLLKVTDTKELSFDEEKGIRKCEGLAYTNGGETKILYQFKKMDDGEYFVEVKEKLF